MRFFIHTLCAMTCLLALLPQTAQAAAVKREEPVEKLPQWPDFIRRQSVSLQALDQCQAGSACTANMARWSNLIASLQGQNKYRQLITVNKWFNRITYKFDEDAYNSVDYWADTAELLEKKGDCEDYALSKYFTLRRLGFQPDQLQIIAVYDKMAYANHAILLVTMDGSRFLLDMNTDDMNPEELGVRYRPIYAFNENKAWFY